MPFPTNAQITAEINNDPEGLGYATYLAALDFVSLMAILNWVRDGSTPCSVNGVVGPNGTITGATNASPIVIASTNHGRTTGDCVVISGVNGNTAANNIPQSPYGLPATGAVAPNPTWTITVVDANHFSLNGSTGNVAYTSGGTWTWCVGAVVGGNKLFNASVPVPSIVANILPADAAAATTLTGTQPNVIATILNPQSAVALTDPDGNELNSIAWLNLLTQTGTVSHKAIKALEIRVGSRAENLWGPGIAPTDLQIRNAFGD